MNFKKCTSFILALLVLVSNIGLAFNVHYCYGKIAAVSSVFSTEEVCNTEKEVEEAKACCTKKNETDHKKCCTDKLVNLPDKPDDSVIKTFSFNFEMPFVVIECKPVFFITVDAQQKQKAISFYRSEAHAPPLFKLYSQYIFYA